MQPVIQGNKSSLLFVALFIGVAVLILQPFLFGIMCGSVTAIAAWPLFRRIAHDEEGLRLGPVCLRARPATASMLLSAAFVVIFITPLAYAGFELAHAYSAGSAYLAHTGQDGPIAPPAILDYLPMHDKVLQFWNENIANSTGIFDVINRVTKGQFVTLVSSLWPKLMGKLVSLLVLLVSFYYMLKNGRYIEEHYKQVCAHWFGARSVDYVNAGIQALRGTVNGVVLIGLLEGLLLSAPLVAGGMRSALLIGLIAGILGVIPMLMPALILPCLAYMYLGGHTGWAIVGLIDLIVVWVVFENIVKPNMISHEVKINPLIVLIAMIGGMQVFGLIGLFLGPAVVAMSIGMLKDLVKLSRV
ncbi:AI-2E family transporter [Burkholderiaceae bacterium DAT-1]|nr:AI-2E family transporter [Burkholderiaceae bacterium DAT-1]